MISSMNWSLLSSKIDCITYELHFQQRPIDQLVTNYRILFGETNSPADEYIDILWWFWMLVAGIISWPIMNRSILHRIVCTDRGNDCQILQRRRHHVKHRANVRPNQSTNLGSDNVVGFSARLYWLLRAVLTVNKYLQLGNNYNAVVRIISDLALTFWIGGRSITTA